MSPMNTGKHLKERRQTKVSLIDRFTALLDEMNAQGITLHEADGGVCVYLERPDGVKHTIVQKFRTHPPKEELVEEGGSDTPKAFVQIPPELRKQYLALPAHWRSSVARTIAAGEDPKMIIEKAAEAIARIESAGDTTGLLDD
jgi:hypothetical protein